MYIKFAQVEELDLKIIRDRKEFKQYHSLIYAEEYNKPDVRN